MSKLIGKLVIGKRFRTKTAAIKAQHEFHRFLLPDECNQAGSRIEEASRRVGATLFPANHTIIAFNAWLKVKGEPR